MPDRDLLSLTLLLTVGTAGCLGAMDAPSPTPAGTTPVETVGECPEDIERLDAGVTNGSLPSQDAGFAIEADRRTVSRGGELTVTLENTAEASRGTGTERMFVLQRHVGKWTTVLGARDGRTGWNATLVTHDPGEGYAWTISLDDEGFAEWGYEPCGSLPAGEYRFVYHGFVEPGEFETEIPEPSIAVAFRITK
ncbi:membrane lipoprotein [Halorhabdus tiamatea SARL4B]|uniref:Membrane lipoprotein n=1 Tax=Halorhabdus tiamatea SARL4B TaxID=1033806 RepID=F7PQA9_9EURY|nr:hypothetical protein [Halorhabdus tiamatea]ERJ04993.1 membrane lipoprotein [Halorhabdus tiamatea SARL4B]CCQ33238.1 hypothetical protein HTIA_1100 [Halorhabdus tiamatea SARL4B]